MGELASCASQSGSQKTAAVRSKVAREEGQRKLSLPEKSRYTSLTCRAAAYLNKRMNRSRLAFANFGTNYEFNPTFGPVILNVELSRSAGQ